MDTGMGCHFLLQEASIYRMDKQQGLTLLQREQYSIIFVQLCPTLCDPWTAAHQVSQSFTISWSLLRLTPIELIIPSNHLYLSYPLFLLPSISPRIRVFSNQSALSNKWPKHWSFSISLSPSNEYLGSISFRIDWLDLLAVKGTLKRLLHYHSSKASILWCSAFLIVQLSHPYMTTGKTTALTRWTLLAK